MEIMSRLNQTNTNSINNKDINDSNTESVEIIYDKIVLNKPIGYDDSERILCIDADSLLYMSTFFPPENLELFPTDELQLEEAKFRIRNKLQEIQNNVEEYYNIKQTLIVLGGKGNFRYKLFPAYKANRKDKEISPLIPLVKKYMINDLQNILLADGCEADDICYEIYKISQANCVISCIDKDIFYRVPGAVVYDYRSYKSKDVENTTIVGTFKSITEKESRLAIASQTVIGDATDGLNFCPKKGKAWCDKNLHENMTDYQFTKAIYKCYIDAWKGDEVLAKSNLKLCFKLMKLWTKDEIKSLNL